MVYLADDAAGDGAGDAADSLDKAVVVVVLDDMEALMSSLLQITRVFSLFLFCLVVE